MVAISLTHDSAKQMANRLREFLAAGGTSIKQTHAYEALAKSLGYRDWNTLLGALQSRGSASQDIAVEQSTTAGAPSPAMPATFLLIDRHAMAAHGVTMAHIESAFRRDYPRLLDKRSQWETMCFEQLPLRPLPAFRPPTISVTLRMPEKAHFHDALMECVKTVAEPKWVFGEQGRDGAMKMTFMFFPEIDVEKLLPAITEAFSRLPAELTVVAVENLDPGPDHPAYGKWRSDGVSYFVWAWETDVGMLKPELGQLVGMALKFNGDELIRLRDVATLHAGTRGAPGNDK
jgi:hypothetical protein